MSHGLSASTLALTRALIERRSLDAVVLSGADAVAWVTPPSSVLAAAGVPGDARHFYFGSVNGGVWKRGRHNRGTGYIKDLEKLNAAQILGWIVGKPVGYNFRKTLSLCRRRAGVEFFPLVNV